MNSGFAGASMAIGPQSQLHLSAFLNVYILRQTLDGSFFMSHKCILVSS